MVGGLILEARNTLQYSFVRRSNTKPPRRAKDAGLASDSGIRSYSIPRDRSRDVDFRHLVIIFFWRCGYSVVHLLRIWTFLIAVMLCILNPRSCFVPVCTRHPNYLQH